MVFATAAQHDQTLACRQSAMTRKWPCIPRALAGTDGSQTVGPAWERVVVLAVTGTKESDKRTISNASSATGPGATNPRHQRSCGAFTHGMVRVLGAIVGPQPLLTTAGPGVEPGMRRHRSAACFDCQLGRKPCLRSSLPARLSRRG